jgi:hypothetical protein
LDIKQLKPTNNMLQKIQLDKILIRSIVLN